jgi:CHAT domain-containing protein/tetratricopeptide (TPR) repeat protein
MWVEASRLLDQGVQQVELGQFRQALQAYEQALVIYRDLKSQDGEARALSNIGLVNVSLGDYSTALGYHEQALVIYRDLKDRDGEARALNNIGSVNYFLGDYRAALGDYDQSLAIARDIKDPVREALTLMFIGNANDSLGDYGATLGYYEQALAIYRDLKDRAGEAFTLRGIGNANQALGDSRAALGYYEQALVIYRDLKDRAGEASTLSRIGSVNHSLGDYRAALGYDEQALVIYRDLKYPIGEAQTLEAIGNENWGLGDYRAALGYYDQALVIYRDLKYPIGEAQTLEAIGNANWGLGDYRAALGYYDQALVIYRDIGLRVSEALTLNRIGDANEKLGDYRAALGYYTQALVIYRDIGYRAGEAMVLAFIGRAYGAQSQPELASLFFKQAVTTYEAIRKDNQPLSSDLQAAYTTTVEDIYRVLADLLLQQDRIFEAQEVLDLLKVQELNDYLRGVRGETADTLTILRPEEEILQRYGELQTRAAAIGQELAQLRQIDPTGRTPAQNQRIDTLVQLQQEMTEQFNDFVTSDQIQTLVDQLSRTAQRQNLNLEDLAALQEELTALKGAVLYPLILEDRLELVITTPNSPPLRRTVNVDRVTLNHAITDFRQVLDNPDDDPKPAAQTLYNYLIRPLEADLVAAGIETIIYAPDGPLRYVPLAALHDGHQWLVENYRVNNITARSLQDLDKAPNPIVDVLAGAFADQSLSYTIPVGRRSQTFQGLPFAGQEVTQLATTLTTTALLDGQFTWAAIRPKMNEFTVVHFATHAAFVPGEPEDSFILFGSGETPTLADIKNWNLTNVDLVVLSACETGLGGVEGNGEEILGLGYQFQRAGARAVIASLWQVDDGGTQALMNAFYRALRHGYSKAEALQRAQQALINDDLSFVGEPRGTIRVVDARTGQPITLRGQSDHPYYWAPFILIGNGL